MMFTFNAERTRAYDDETVFGVACYEFAAKVDDSHSHFVHRGVVESVEDAQRWINGEDVKIIRVYE